MRKTELEELVSFIESAKNRVHDDNYEDAIWALIHAVECIADQMPVETLRGS